VLWLRASALRIFTNGDTSAPADRREFAAAEAEADRPRHEGHGGGDPQHVRSETQAAVKQCEQQRQQDDSHRAAPFRRLQAT
jgi:hypothetical protein